MPRRTVDLLPEIFQTSTNKQFLAATLDQLTQEPAIKRTQGYVGRRVGPGVDPADNYVTEPTKSRVDYQLEPGIVFFKCIGLDHGKCPVGCHFNLIFTLLIRIVPCRGRKIRDNPLQGQGKC